MGIEIAIGNMLPQDKATYIKNCKNRRTSLLLSVTELNDSPSLARRYRYCDGKRNRQLPSKHRICPDEFGTVILAFALGLAKATKNNMVQNIVPIGVVNVLLLSVFFSE